MVMLITCLVLIGKRDGPFDAAVPTLPPHTYIIVLRNSKHNYWKGKDDFNFFKKFLSKGGRQVKR
jgi:hypothetical protein